MSAQIPLFDRQYKKEPEAQIIAPVGECSDGKNLFHNFDDIASASNAPARLRDLVLGLAFAGRLVVGDDLSPENAEALVDALVASARWRDTVGAEEQPEQWSDWRSVLCISGDGARRPLC